MLAASRLGRAGVLPAGKLPVSSAPARVRLPQPSVCQRRGAQVGGRDPELPPGVSAERAEVRGGTGRTGIGALTAVIFTLQLEGVPLPVPADAKGRSAGHSGKAVV